jgi:uncharacterized membrane protein YhaH (DUF805 family)
VAVALAPLWARVYAARLHDVGRSGWWQALAWGLGAALVGGLMQSGASAKTLADAALAVWVTTTVAIGAFPGRPTANRFGPAPGEASPVALAEAFR